MKIRLNVELLEDLQKKNLWSDSELARQIGISRSRLWRAKLPMHHKEYCSPGETLIMGILQTFPNKKFDDFFFLEHMCSEVHKGGE